MVPPRDQSNGALPPADPRLSLLYDLHASLRVISDTVQQLEGGLRDGWEPSPGVSLALVTQIAASVREMLILLRQIESDES